MLELCQKIEKQDKNMLEIMEKQEIKEEQIEKIAKALVKSYSYEASTKIPTKTSVTRIKQGLQEKNEIHFPAPKFAQKEEDIPLTGSQKGTLVHLCMQKLDEKQEYDLLKIKEFISDLERKEIITPKEAQSINPMLVLKFTQSEIWQGMKQAKEIQREKPFYRNIQAKEIYQEEVEELVLVQGVIDLYYRDKNDEIVLVDYKTDFVQKPEELVAKYKSQLAFYKKALEEALEQKVQHVFIYSTFLAKEIEVEMF